VLLLIGDDFNDFVAAGPSAEARAAAAAAYDNYWGERWFLLPNPTYGSWERAVGYKVDEKLLKLRK
jgi:acid phosphatase